MCEGDRIMEIVLSLVADLVDVNRIIMGSKGQVLFIGGVDHDFAPLSRLVQSRNSLGEIIVV